MWYALQILIAAPVAYLWTTLPDNSPADLGHGLFLGGILAWCATLLLSAIVNTYRNRPSKQTQLTGINRLPRLRGRK